MASGFSAQLIRLLIRLLQIYNIVILVRALMSWFMPDPGQPFYRLLIRITEPVLGPVRRILPAMGLDISPVIVMIAIQIIIRLLAGLV